MAPADAAVVARARACLAAPFRAHGRDPARGLDCVGLAAVAFGLARAPAGYRLRGGRVERIRETIAGFGFVAAAPGPARLLLLEAGPFQFHLGVGVPGGFVHADAGLRRVVEVPGLPRWPLLGCWRYHGEG